MYRVKKSLFLASKNPGVMRTGVKRYCYEKKKFNKVSVSQGQGLTVAGFGYVFQKVIGS